MSSQPRRLSIIRNLENAHKKDIEAYVSGHLNQNNLLKLEESCHKTWLTSLGPTPRMKPATKPVHLPVRKGQLPWKQQHYKNMKGTIREFSYGALGHYCLQKGLKDEVESSGCVESNHSKFTKLKNHHDDFRAQELKLPEIMVVAIDNDGLQPLSSNNVESKSNNGPSKRRHFLKSHLSHVTKADQYCALRSLKNHMINSSDVGDSSLFMGDHIVRTIRHHLNKKLQSLSESTKRCPNFHRLQLYSDCFAEIIKHMPSFSNLLRQIKEEYDGYLAYVLDQNKLSKFKDLYAQIPAISEAKTTADAVRLQQIQLENLENEIQFLLNENKSLHIQEREKLTIPLNPSSPHNSEQGGIQTRVYVEAVVKDLEEQIEHLHSQIAQELETLENMRKHQHDNCVPSSICQHFEHCIKEIEVDIQKMLQQNEYLEQSIEELETELQSILLEHKVPPKQSKTLWSRLPKLSTIIEYGRSQKHHENNIG
ncbi:uncharacterized protein LOC124452928 [Xenia sp. Carnegie-2017]|uniref:uncharacterized protein LOC124452928 n=1 Tax=Xenia sp. Carnegie-2017 TaxID=2897299 RepID=UPI001F03C6B5|nr:uncharacterized protein LOC124452928 [Xenia sp. Carnegie-2017]